MAKITQLQRKSVKNDILGARDDMFSSSSPDILKPQKAPQQIITKIRRAILAERLVEGDRLPPEPELMRHFGVSRQTI